MPGIDIDTLVVDRQPPVNGAVHTLVLAGSGTQHARRVTTETDGSRAIDARQRLVSRVEVLRTLRVTEWQQKVLPFLTRV